MLAALAPALSLQLPPVLGALSIGLIVAGCLCIGAAVVWQWRIDHE